MPEQTVSGVTAGDSGGLGRPKTFLSSYSAGSLSFDFTAPYTLPSTLSVAFYFGGQQIVIAGAGNQAKLGPPRVTNAALDFAPIGFDSLRFSRSRVYKSVENTGAAIDFLFTETYTQPYPPSFAPFWFGGQIVIVKAGASVYTAFGKPSFDIRQRIDLQDDIGGIAPKLEFGRPRVSTQQDLNFLFVDTYTPTTAINTPFYFGGQIVAYTRGADSSRFGVPNIKIPRPIAPAGFSPSVFGRAGIRFGGASGLGVDFLFTAPYTAPLATDVPFVFPFRSLEGIARVSVFARIQGEAAQLSSNVAVNTTATGFLRPQADLRAVVAVNTSATADLSSLPFLDVEGFTQAVVEPPTVTFFVRRLYPRDITTLELGTHTVWYRVRPLITTSIFFDPPESQFGIASVKDSLQVIDPDGAQWTLFGQTSVYRDEQFFKTKGFLWTLFGNSFVELSTNYISPDAIDEKYDSAHYLYNERQYVTHTRKDLMLYLVRYNEIITGYGSPTVVNRNQTIGPFERPSGLRIGEFLAVRNKARLIKPGLFEVIPLNKPMVSLRVRTLPVSGFDSSEYSNRALVYNAAFQIITEGNDFGVVSPLEFIESNLRTISDVFAGDWPTPQPSAPFVAYRVRTINVETRAGAVYGGIRPTYDSGLATVQLGTQYIIQLPPPPTPPIGFPPLPYQGGFGVAFLVAWINKITISWGFPPEFGAAGVKNKTPQLDVLGRPTKAEFGRPIVWYRVRTIDLDFEGIPSQIAVADRNYTVISFRTRRIDLTSRGIAPVRITNLHKVRKNTLDPPGDQQIYDILSIFSYPPLIGLATVTANSLYAQGWDSLRFGQTQVNGQIIFPVWDWPDSQFSWGVPVLNPKTIVSPGSISSGAVLSSHRVDPYTIYCTPDITPQAFRNHGFKSFNIINLWGPDRFGQIVVTLKYQTLKHYHTRDSYTGLFYDIGPYFSNTASIELKRRTLQVTGIEPEYLGYPVVTPFDAEIFPPPFNNISGADSGIGAHRLRRRGGNLTPTQTITVAGYLATLFGTQKVELFNREVTPQGFMSTVFGNNVPMVHHPRTVTNVGNVMSLYGTAWVAYRVRSVFPEGWGQFESGDSPNFFNSRIRVRYGTIRVKPDGLAATTYGVTGVRNAQQVIRAFQIAPPRCGVSHDLAIN